VTGNTEITLTGTGFTTSQADISVIIDGVSCVVTAATATEIKCDSGSRPGLPATSMVVSINGVGNVALQGNTFTYVSAWSEPSTWGNDFAPIEGDSIHIPTGMNLLIDIDQSPLLKAVIVEGSIIFQPHLTDATHHRSFDAHYIFVRNGRMEVGTEEFPYTSKVTITMHSRLSDPFMPIYGNKVLGVRFGTLDMHGPVRVPTWTLLESTAAAGANTITLQKAVDW
jgi:hypothetical protein